MATTATPEAIRSWASEWSDLYAQDWSEEKLSEWTGKRIKTLAEVNGEPKGFEGTVVGYSIDTLVLHESESEDSDEFTVKVHRFSFIIDEGLQCSIFAEMTVEEVEQE